MSTPGGVVPRSDGSVGPPAPMGHSSAFAAIKGFAAYYAAYMTATSKEDAIRAVELVWAKHASETPTVDNAYDLMEEIVGILLSVKGDT